MKRKIKRHNIIFSSFILAALILITSCKHNFTGKGNNTLEDDYPKYIILKLNPELAGRQASPMLDQEILDNLEFEVTATNHQTNRSAPSSSDPDFFSQNENSNDPYEYKIKLAPGDWDVTVTGLYNGDEILEGSKLVSVRSNGSYHEEIKMYFIYPADGGYGFVDLEIDVTDVPNIASLEIKRSGNTTLNSIYYVEEGNGKRLIHISPVDEISAGNYNPILSFCTSDGTVLISIPETISVSNNMTTKYWIKSARNPFLSAAEADGSSKFVVTPALISQALNTIFYVNRTGGLSTNSGNDSSSPINNIENAFKRINANNNNDSIQNIQRDYIIFVENGAVASTLKADNPLNLYIYTIGTSKLSLTGALRVETNVNLTIENFTISSAFNCLDNSQVTANNISFSRNVNVGYDPTDETIDSSYRNITSLTITDCTIGGSTYCYANGTDKCTIDATNCTFNNTITNFGTITASGSGIERYNLICNGTSTTSFTALSTARKNIKGYITLNNSSSATFTNMNIGLDASSDKSVTLKDTSTAEFENVEINKNVDAQTGTNITFIGTTHFTGTISSPSSSYVNLASGVVLKLKDVASGLDKLAAIKVADPSPNRIVIESAVTGQTVSQAQVERFELHNNGYYLDYDSTNAKGIVKLSSMQIKEPTFGGCTITITGDKTTNSLGVISIGRDTDTGEKDLVITVSDPDENALTVTSVKQYLGTTEIQSAPGSAATTRTISFKCSVLETYTLEIRYKYKEIEYSALLTVKII